MTKATLFRTATIAALTVMIGGAQPAQTAFTCSLAMYPTGTAAKKVWS